MYPPFLNRFECNKKLAHDTQADHGGDNGARRPENGWAVQKIHLGVG